MHALVLQLKELNPDLKRAEIEGLLHLLLTRTDLTNTSLIQETGLPKETLRHFKTSMSRYLADTKGDRISLNEKALPIIKEVAPKQHKWSILSYQDSSAEEKFMDIYSLAHQGSLAKRDYDQFFALPSTSVSKVRLLQDKGFIEGNNLAFLGDDDVVSGALALLDPTYKSVRVFDIDRSLLKGIDNVVTKYALNNFKAHFYDAREPFTAVDAGRYDVVVTDPPYTKQGVKLFLNRAVELLGTSPDLSGKYIVLFYGNSFKSPEKTLKVQDLISDFNLVIEDKIDKFARYFGAESIGSASSAYVLKTTPFTHTLPDAALINDIYTFNESKEERFPFVDHYTFKLFNVNEQIVYSKNAVSGSIGEFMKIHKLKVVDTKVTGFKNSGLSFTFVLASSNLLLHTWPEFNAIHIDLITCSPIYKREAMVTTLSKLFQTKNIESRHVE